MPISPPTLLTDLTRLPEIYALRVACWEQSPGQPYVNRELFLWAWSNASNQSWCTMQALVPSRLRRQLLLVYGKLYLQCM